jgi:predicted TIM-barrel fold metal-dependent hydrolase
MPHTDQAQQFFDAHCHVFNLEYLFREAAQMAWDYFWGLYPKAARSPEEKNAISFVDNLKNIFTWIIQIASAAFGSEERNAQFVMDCGKETFHKDICIVPLMMDIYYMFAPPLTRGAQATRNATHKKAKNPEEAFNNFIDEVIANNSIEIIKNNAGIDAILGLDKNKNRTKTIGRTDIEKLIHQAAENVTTWSGKNKARDEHYHVTNGYQYEIDSMIRLRQNPQFGDKVYPFLAVDPRRPGIIDAIRKGNIVVDPDKGPFFGIKLYPRLGYMPNVPELDDLYRYCETKSIPIITHCSYGGFPVQIGSLFANWPYCNFGAPQNYESIFKAHPNIRIDLAHFGDSGTNVIGADRAPWADTIVTLMQRYDGRVFSDMACTTNSQVIANWIVNYGNDPSVFAKTMFGSDFDVMYFMEAGITLQKYDSHFVQTLSEHKLDLGQMMGENVTRFLWQPVELRKTKNARNRNARRKVSRKRTAGKASKRVTNRT